jgi:glycosyltransferase involved in cell wall biosynthesis
MSKIVGSIVYSNNTGLGVLARDFYNHGLINKVIIQPTDKEPIIQDRFWAEDVYKKEELARFIDEIDVLFILEQYLPYPYQWENSISLQEIRNRGKKIVLMPMYECTHPGYYSEVDFVICPSLLDLDIVKYFGTSSAKFIPVPVEENWKKRGNAKVFIHNAGYSENFRNGTKEVLEAMQYVKNDVQLIVRCQGGRPELENLIGHYAIHDQRIIPHIGEIHREELYQEGDVFLFPEKYNGLSLPLQEAFASGMGIMAGNRFPINTWLPPGMLIKVDHYTFENHAVSIQLANFNPVDIAFSMDRWYNVDIGEFSIAGKNWAENNSWERLIPLYKEILFQ